MSETDNKPTLGRKPHNDIQIDSKFVSRHHCQIITTPVRHHSSMRRPSVTPIQRWIANR